MDAQRIDALFKEVRREIQKDISIPGFRKGKIPSSILNSRFGNLILSEVAEKAHRELSDMLFDENDWILSDTEPEFKPVLPSEGRDYDYTVTYTLFETPEPRDYSGIEVPVPEFDREGAGGSPGGDREPLRSYDPVERAAGAGDLVVLEYSSRDKGETRRAAVVIGRENMGPGFDEMLPGLSPGDSFAAAMEFPGMEEPLKATTITVMEVREPRRPQLDDEFARTAGGFESMEQLREKVLQQHTGETPGGAPRVHGGVGHRQPAGCQHFPGSRIHGGQPLQRLREEARRGRTLAGNPAERQGTGGAEGPGVPSAEADRHPRECRG